MIELLVVIAIIAILAGLLFPVFARAKEAANQSATLSNIHQLGVAASLYESDHDDMGLAATDGQPGAGMLGGWVYYSAFDGPFEVEKGALYPYVKNKQIYVGKGVGKGEERKLTFGINGCLTEISFREGISSGYNAGRSMTLPPDPATIMQFGEEGHNEFANASVTNDGFLNPLTDFLSIRWNNRSHCLFADKHAKLVPVGSDGGVVWLTGNQPACP